MNRFVIVDGLPYLLTDGKTYACRFDENGFTVGAEVTLASVPDVWHHERAILAQCAGNLDSIKANQEPETTEDEVIEDDETTEDDEPSLIELTLAELKDYAKYHNIDLGGARTKAAILEAIIASEQAVS